MNIQIDFENVENQFLSRIYRFYGLLQSVPGTSPDTPDKMLRFIDQMDRNGMNSVQFFIFMKDMNAQPYASNRVICH